MSSEAVRLIQMRGKVLKLGTLVVSEEEARAGSRNI